jgi:hypothetical protein
VHRRIRSLVGHAVASRESLLVEIGLGVIGSLHMRTSTDHPDLHQRPRQRRSFIVLSRPPPPPWPERPSFAPPQGGDWNCEEGLSLPPRFFEQADCLGTFCAAQGLARKLAHHALQEGLAPLATCVGWNPTGLTSGRAYDGVLVTTALRASIEVLYDLHAATRTDHLPILHRTQASSSVFGALTPS